MISISTKTGDQGQTSLANGKRVPKHSLVMEFIGGLDELSSWLGLIVAELREKEADLAKAATEKFSATAMRADLEKIQQQLYEISAEVAQYPGKKYQEADLADLEAKADVLQEQLADDWHRQFLFPGGTVLGGYFDVARTVARRVERVGFKLSEVTTVSPVILKFLNRLSDYLYLLRCQINQLQQYQEKELKSKK